MSEEEILFEFKESLRGMTKLDLMKVAIKLFKEVAKVTADRDLWQAAEIKSNNSLGKRVAQVEQLQAALREKS